MDVSLRRVTRGLVRWEHGGEQGELKIFELPGGCWQLASSLPGYAGAWNFSSGEEALHAARAIDDFIVRERARRRARTLSDSIIVRLSKGPEHCYVLWDPVHAIPASAAWTRAELEATLVEIVDRRARARAKARLERLDRTGTSAYRGLVGLIAYNRAGSAESSLTMIELFEQAMRRRNGRWPWE